MNIRKIHLFPVLFTDNERFCSDNKRRIRRDPTMYAERRDLSNEVIVFRDRPKLYENTMDVRVWQEISLIEYCGGFNINQSFYNGANKR